MNKSNNGQKTWDEEIQKEVYQAGINYYVDSKLGLREPIKKGILKAPVLSKIKKRALGYSKLTF